MEIIVGIVIIVILLLCLGADIGFIAMLGLGVLVFLLAALFGLFLVMFVAVLASERVTGEFVEVRTREDGFAQACYEVDGEEFLNLFPCEVVLRDKLYKKGKPVKLRLLRKKRLLFDGNAQSVIIVGLTLCPICALALVGLVGRLWGWW